MIKKIIKLIFPFLLITVAFISFAEISATAEPQYPTILSAAVSPQKVRPGDMMLVTAEVQDSSGIASVTADMAGIETIELQLTNGTLYSGVWQSKWLVHSTENKNYITTITAVNTLGLSSSAAVEWSDPTTWWNYSWKYRKPIQINNSGTSNLTDYQVALNITYNSNMNSTFQDLRFTYYNTTYGNETEIPYWIENYSSQNATVWIKVPIISNTTNATVYMYYGNPSATSASNGTAVFLLFDDFEDGDISDWSASGATQSINSTIVYERLYSIKVSDTGSGAVQYTYKNSTSGIFTAGQNYTVESYVYWESGGSANSGIRCLQKNSTGNTLYSTDIIINTKGSWLLATYSGPASTGIDHIRFQLVPTGDSTALRTGTSLYDIARIRKSSSPEPATSIGSEENHIPQIQFVSPTDSNNAYISRNWTYVNVSVSDTDNTTSFIDWNRSLLGWWRFESVNTTNHTLDNSTWKNDGKLYNFNTNPPQTVAGKFGNALQFDGVDDYIGLNSTPVGNETAFTISAWFKTTSTSKGQIYHEGNGSSFTLQQTYFTVAENTAGDIEFGIVNDTDGWAGCNWTGNLNDGNWHYAVAVQRNKTYREVFVDGVSKCFNTTWIGNVKLNASRIGSRAACVAEFCSYAYFNGTIDEVQIWNRALSPEEINASYNSGIYQLYRNFSSLTDGTYQYYAASQDLAGNVNTTETRTLTVDTIKPTWQNNATKLSSPQIYNTATTYGWQITWNDANFANATFQLGRPTGTITNYTTATTPNTQNTSNLWWINFTQNQIGQAGTYNYTWFGIDTLGLQNKTDTIGYTISVNSTNMLNLYFNNGTQYLNQNITVTYLTQTNATGLHNYLGNAPAINLYYNNQSTVWNNTLITLGAGQNEFVLNTSGNANYSSNERRFWINVNKGTLTLIIASNGTQTYPYTSTAEGWENNIGDTDVTYWLTRNGLLVDNSAPYFETNTLGVGTYVYRYNTSSGTNYANWTANATGVTTTLTINKGTPTNMNIYINSLLSDTTTTYPSTATIVANASALQGATDLSYTLYRLNTTSLGTGTSITNNEAYSNSTITFQYNTTSGTNYTQGNATIRTLKINKGTPTTFNCYIDDLLSDKIITYPAIAKTTCNSSALQGATDATYYMYKNDAQYGTGISQIENQRLANGTYVYRFGILTVTNWTATNSSVRTLKVNKGTLSLSIFSNGTQSYPFTSTTEGIENNLGNTDITYWLTRNGALVDSTSPYIETNQLGVGTYVYKFNTSSATDYTNWTANATGVTTTLTINQGTRTVSLTLDGQASDITRIYNGTSVLYPVVASESNTADTDCVYTLYENAVSTGQTGSSITYNVNRGNNTFVFAYNSSACTNWTAVTQSRTLKINKGTLNLTITNPQTVTYPTQTTVTGTETNTGDTDVTYKLYRDNTLLTGSSETNTLGGGITTYKFNATSSTNWTQNDTGVSSTVTVNKGTLSYSTSSAPTVTYPTDLTVTFTEANIGDTDVVYQTSCIDKYISTGLTATFDLPAGTHNCKLNTTSATFTNWTANASITTIDGIVNKGLPALNIYIDNIQQNKTVTYGTSVTVRANETNAGDTDLIYNLYRNDLLLLTGSDVSRTEVLGNNSLWIFRYNTSDGTNYSLSNATIRAVQVLKADGSSYLNVYIDDILSDKTVTYPTIAKVTGNHTIQSGNTDLTYTLFFNSASYATGDSVTRNERLANDTYLIIFGHNQGTNWTISNSSTRTLQVLKGTSDTKTYINANCINRTIDYPTSATIIGNSTTTVTPPSFNLYLNGFTTSGNPSTLTNTYAAGTYNVIYNTSGNTNWTSASNNTLYLIINKGTLTLSISGGGTATYPNASHITATESNSGDTDITYWLTKDGLLKDSTSPYADQDSYSAGTHVFKFNTSASTYTNWTANATGVTTTLYIMPANTSTRLFLNDTEGNKTYNVGQIFNITVTLNITGKNVAIGGNLTTKAAATTPSNITGTINMTAGAYNVTGYFDGDANYTASSQRYWAFVFGWMNTTAYVNNTYVKKNDILNIGCLLRDSNSSLALQGFYVEIYNGTTNISGGRTGSSGWYNNTNFVVSSEGTVTITCAVYDNATSYYNVSKNGTTVYTADFTPPLISIQSPMNQTYAQKWVWANVTLNEAGSWCAVSLNNTANQTLTNSTGNWNLNLSVPSEGSNNVIFYCNDTAGNMNASDIRYFTIDTILPQIQFVSPTDSNNAYVNRNYSYVNVSVSDTDNTTSFIDWNRSLVGWWRLESVNATNHTLDNSTWKNDGKLYNFNTNPPQTVAGKFGNALQFDGVDDYVDCGNAASLQSIQEAVTVEAWIKTNIASISQNIITKGYAIELQIYSNARIELYSDDGVDATQVVSSANTINSNEWTHVVGVARKYSGDWTSRVYINGVLNGTNTNTNYDGPLHFDRTDQPVKIGVQKTGGYFNGTIDEVKIWNRALSPEEINASYNSGIYQLYRNFSSLTDGTYQYYAASQDLAGNVNTTETRTLTVDTVKPTITIILPENTNYTSTSRTLNYTVTDASSLSWCGYSLNAGANQTLQSCSNTSFTAAGGLNNITVFANDSAGNMNASVTRYFYIDTTAPVYVNVGQNVSAINESGVVLLYTQWSDNVNLSTAILSTNESGAWQNKTTYGSPVTFSGASGWSNFTWQNNSVKGKVVGWRIFANDWAGNQNATSVNAFAVYKHVTVRTLDKNNNYKNSTIKILNTTDSDAVAGISNATGFLETDVYPGSYDVSAEVSGLGIARIKSIDISLLDALNISFDNDTISTSYPQNLSVSRKVFFNVSQQLGTGYALNITASSGLSWQKCLSPPCTAAGWTSINPSSEGAYINFVLTYSDPELLGGTAPNVRIAGYALYSKTGLPMANANVTAVIRETGDITNTTTDSNGSFDLWFNAVLQQGRTYTVAIKVVDSQGRETYLIERVKR